MSLAVAAGVLAAVPAACQEGGEGLPDGDVVANVTVEGVVLQPPRPDKPDARLVSVILGETKRGGRKLIIALPVKGGARQAAEAAEAGTDEAKSTYVMEEERVQEWARRELVETSRLSQVGMIELSELSSRIELTCPRQVNAGEVVVLRVKSVGNFDDVWKASLVYPTSDDRLIFPDGGRYETQSLSVGDKVGGKERVVTARFTTYPADRDRTLGVRIERSARAEDGVTLWVKVR